MSHITKTKSSSVSDEKANMADQVCPVEILYLNWCQEVQIYVASVHAVFFFSVPSSAIYASLSFQNL